jgi:hypothetical protein
MELSDTDKDVITKLTQLFYSIEESKKDIKKQVKKIRGIYRIAAKKLDLINRNIQAGSDPIAKMLQEAALKMRDHPNHFYNDNYQISMIKTLDMQEDILYRMLLELKPAVFEKIPIKIGIRLKQFEEEQRRLRTVNVSSTTRRRLNSTL